MNATYERKTPLCWDTAKIGVHLRVLLRDYSLAQDLLQGISYLSDIYDQICRIEKALKAGNELLNAYSSRRIDYELLKKKLREKLPASIVDELMLIGRPNVTEQKSVGSFDPSDPMLPYKSDFRRVECELGIEGDLGRIAIRLVMMLRADGGNLYNALREMDSSYWRKR